MLSLIPCHSSAWSEAQVAPIIHKPDPDPVLHIPEKQRKPLSAFSDQKL